MVKNLPANEGDMVLIPGSGRYPGEENGTPLQSSCLENSMDSGAWRATAHGVPKSRTRLSDKQQEGLESPNGTQDSRCPLNFPRHRTNLFFTFCVLHSPLSTIPLSGTCQLYLAIPGSLITSLLSSVSLLRYPFPDD